MTIAECMPERKIEFEADQSVIVHRMLEMEKALEENRLKAADDIATEVGRNIRSLMRTRFDIYRDHRRWFDHSADDLGRF